MPTWIRSSSSTLAGSLAIIWCARRRTSGLYCLSIELTSSWPLAVYMDRGSGGNQFKAWASPLRLPRATAMRMRCRRPAARRRSATALAARRRQQHRARQARAGRGGGASAAWLAGSTRAQSCSSAPRKVSAQRASCVGDALRARRGRRRTEQQVEDHQAARAARAASSRRRRGSRWPGGRRPAAAAAPASPASGARTGATARSRRRARAPRRPAARRRSRPAGTAPSSRGVST